MEPNEPNNIFIGMIKGIITCFTNLNSIKEHFKKDLIQTLCSSTDNQNMALLNAGKELIDKLNNQDMIESSLDTFTIEYISLFNNSYDEQNKTLNCLNIISNIIEKWHKDENFESRNYNENTLKNQSYENEAKKEFMLVLFMDYFETINTSMLSKIIFSSNILIKQCTLCNSITYNFEIQKIFQFNINEIIDFKSQKNNNEEILTVSLDDCFNYFISPKNNNNCKCKKEGCNSSCSNIKKVLYWTNNIIIIYLYRSTYNKMYKDLDIDKTLDLSKYLDKDSLKNLTMTDNKIMSYVYDLSSMFYFDGDEYISCCRKNKNEDIWYYSYNGVRSEECSDIFNQLTQFENFQPVLLFYEYKNDPNAGLRENLQNENILIFPNWDDEIQNQQKKEVNKNVNLNNENEVKKEDIKLIENQNQPEIMNKKDIKDENISCNIINDTNNESHQIEMNKNNMNNSNNIKMDINMNNMMGPNNMMNMNNMNNMNNMMGINNMMNMNNMMGQNNMMNMNNMMPNNMNNMMSPNNIMNPNNMMNMNNMMNPNNMMNMNNMMNPNNMMNMNNMISPNNMMNMNNMMNPNNMMNMNNIMGQNNMMNMNNMMGPNDMMNMNNMIRQNNMLNMNNNFNFNMNQNNNLGNSLNINMNQNNNLSNSFNLMMNQNNNFNRSNSMNININSINNLNNNNSNFFTVDFKFIKKNNETFTLKVQASNDTSIKNLINNFKTKLSDNSIVIEKYLFNNNEELDRNSDQIISLKGINNNSIITAIEA